MSDTARPLLIVDSPDLLDDLLRLAATAGYDAEVVTAAALARSGWARAPVVVVAAALVSALVTAGLPRRSGVVVVAQADEESPGSGADRAVYPGALALGAERVIHLPGGEGALVDYLAASAERSVQPGTVVAVVGGRGGGGATTLAVALALAGTRRGLDTVLVDADPLGGGIDLAFGAEDVVGMRWPDLVAVRGRVAGRTLAGALPFSHGVLLVSWDRRATAELDLAAVSAVFAGARRSGDLVVLDLPRHLNEPARLMLGYASTALVVLPGEVRAAAAAARVTAVVSELCPDLRLVLRGPAPGGLDAASVTAALGVPMAGVMRAEPGLALAAERGEPPGQRSGPLARLAEVLVTELVESR